MNNEIVLSRNPTYLCNFRCKFCYLSPEQLANKETIGSERLFEILSEISSNRKIVHIDLYGGEVALLNLSYVDEFFKVLKVFYNGKVNVITNLSKVPNWLLRDDVEISVSWDYSARELHEKVFKNMHNLQKEFHILILASDSLLNMADSELDNFILKLNSLKNLKTVEIKPYSQSTYNKEQLGYVEYEEWIKRWILKRDQFLFEFINEKKIIDSLEGLYSSWSDNHLYITPKGKIAVLDFDNLGQEYFLDLKHFSDYEHWIRHEKEKIMNDDDMCTKCIYLGHCLSEHLKPVSQTDLSCNGFKNLLSWYKNERL